MPHPKELVEKGSLGWDARFNMHKPYAGIVELAFRGRATLELGPAPTLASIDFRGNFYSVLVRSWGEDIGRHWAFWGILSCVGCHRSLVVLTDRRKLTDGSCCTRSFSLLSWLVLYILAFALYKVGSTAMAFGQVQGSAGGGPPLPQILTHLKEAEQQGQSTIVGKGFPHMSRMVHLPWVSGGPTSILGPGGAPLFSPW